MAKATSKKEQQNNTEKTDEGNADSVIMEESDPIEEDLTVSEETETAYEADPALEMQSAEFQKLDTESINELKDKKLELLMDLSLPVSIELGRTNLMIKNILNLQRGSIVEFEKLASEPVDILINGKKMAEGEVVVIEKHFGIRITSLIDASERIKSLGA